MVWHKP